MRRGYHGLGVWLLLGMGLWLCGSLRAKDAEEEKVAFDPLEMINHHILDAHVWHFFDGPYGTLYLPVLLYSSDRGLEMFSSARFFDEHHEPVSYRGYRYEHHHIVPEEEGRKVWDFSITKNVASLFLNAALVLLVFLAVARRYGTHPNATPKGLQALIEPVILFLRDEVIRPCIGEKRYLPYLPYLLTLFFFILFGNLLGLLPGAANLTGNIAVTMVLAVMTFLITNFSGNKHYWQHVFNMPGVPLFIKPLITLIECIGLFTKPVSLMIRLFVAITAGHIVILSLLGLAFIFQSYTVGLMGSLIVLFINLIELLVAAIQAYVFTMFSALYIGMAVAEKH